jgi:hypothetical protein
MAYLWSEQNPYLHDYGIEVVRGAGPADVVSIPCPYLPGTETFRYRDSSLGIGTVPADDFEFFDTPLVCESAMDYAYLDAPTRVLVSSPQVRALTTGSRYRDEEPQLRGTWGGDYYGAAYRQRRLYDTSPEPRRVRQELPPDVQRKIRPLCRPPSYPFADDVFRYINAKVRPLAERPIDVFFSGRVAYHHRRSVNHVTDHRLIALDKLENLNGVKTVCVPYDDHHGRRRQGRPVRSFRYPFEYCDALLASRVVVSPWGWSPWAIRDCEALACGCVVIKPECSNLVIVPDIYDPRKQLLVWCDVLFENLEDRIRFVLDHLHEFQERADRGRECVYDALYPNAKVFRMWTSAMREIFERAADSACAPASAFRPQVV